MLSLAMLPLLALLAACGGPPKDSSQVAAKVNSGEITVHQVEVAMRSQPSPPGTSPEAAGRRVLDALVEDEIAAQAAHAEGLDHDPEVVQALELGRREMLARLYRGRTASKVAAPTPEEIDRFYESNPGLFAKRRLYTIQELAVSAPASMQAQLAEVAKAARGADELADSLHKAGLNFRTRLTVKSAEDLNIPLVNAFAAMGEGQSLAVPQKDGASIYTLIRIQDAPLDRATARDQIYAYIANDRRRAAVAQRMQSLKDQAHITYVGMFASAAASSPTPAATPSAPLR